ncbi:MAG: hypothetical protein ACHQCF_02090 [Solirubrobacterales bacterium]
MAGIGAIALGARLGAAPRRGLGWLGQAHLGAYPAQLLDHKAPARRRLQGDFQLMVGESIEKAAHPGPVCGGDARSRQLPGVGVDPIGADLRSVLVKSHDDRHFGASSSSTVYKACADQCRA